MANRAMLNVDPETRDLVKEVKGDRTYDETIRDLLEETTE